MIGCILRSSITQTFLPLLVVIQVHWYTFVSGVKVWPPFWRRAYLRRSNRQTPSTRTRWGFPGRVLIKNINQGPVPCLQPEGQKECCFERRIASGCHHSWETCSDDKVHTFTSPASTRPLSHWTLVFLVRRWPQTRSRRHVRRSLNKVLTTLPWRWQRAPSPHWSSVEIAFSTTPPTTRPRPGITCWSHSKTYTTAGLLMSLWQHSCCATTVGKDGSSVRPRKQNEDCFF